MFVFHLKIETLFSKLKTLDKKKNKENPSIPFSLLVALIFFHMWCVSLVVRAVDVNACGCDGQLVTGRQR